MAIDLKATPGAEPLESLLAELYAVAIPASTATLLDARVASAIAARAAQSGRRPQLLARPRLVVALAALVVIATAAASPVVRFFEDWGQPFDRISEQSTRIDDAVTIDGYRVTLVRAYADALTVRLAISAEDLEARGWAEINAGEATVRDASGRLYPMELGSFRQPSTETGASWLTFSVPPAAAADEARSLTVELDRISVRSDPAPTAANGSIDAESAWSSVRGLWTFAFDVPVFGARSLHGDTSATVAGVTATLRSLTVTPITTRVRLTFEGLPERPADSAWDPDVRLERDGEVLDISSLHPGSVRDQLEFDASPGFDDLSGTWVVTIEEFHRDIPDPAVDVTTESESIKGPWILTLEGPPPAAS